MSAATAGITAGTVLTRLRGSARRALQWWLAEFHATVPSRFAFRVGGVPRPSLTIAVSSDGRITGELSQPAGTVAYAWGASDFGPDTIARTVGALQLRREDVDVKFACDAELFLQRKMLVPRVALATLPAILAQDILHRTPFEADQIWHAAAPQGAEHGSDVVTLQHWIIRRDRAIAELARGGLRIDDVDALTVRDSGTPPTIPFRVRSPDDRLRAGRTLRFLAAAAVAVTVVGLAALMLFEAVTAARIETAMAELRQSDAMLTEGNGAAQLYAMKTAPDVVDIWADLSRVLPDDTFLSELRIADGAIAVSGFSSNAAQLVRLVDQSPAYTAAHLTAAITPDATERKDRFSLAFLLRGSPVRNAPAAATARGSQ